MYRREKISMFRDTTRQQFRVFSLTEKCIPKEKKIQFLKLGLLHLVTLKINNKQSQIYFVHSFA